MAAAAYPGGWWGSNGHEVSLWLAADGGPAADGSVLRGNNAGTTRRLARLVGHPVPL